MKKLRVTVNGKTYDVGVEEVSADATGSAPPAPVSSAPAPAAAPVAGEGEPVTAPMPGNILKVPVTAGAAVKRGDVLVVLEAMKMENEICAPRDGTVTSVLVAPGETVDSGKTLLTLR